MSINSALLSGVTGLVANSAALGAISDNISNVNTVGYKENSTQFEDLVTSKATQGNYNSGGVQANVTQLISQQGQFTQTQSSTDLAINGNGMFVVSQTAAGLSATSGPTYTRAGSFTPDSAGNLVNSAGLYLQGWAADSTGAVSTSPSDITKLSTINIGDIGSAPAPTSTASLSANLDSNTDATDAVHTGYNATTNSMAMYDANPATGTKPDFSTQLTVYDSQGGQHTVQLDFLKTSTANQWDVEVNGLGSSGAADSDLASANIASGTVNFNSDGSFKSATLGGTTYASGTPISLSLPWTAASGLTTPQTLALNLGGTSGSLTQNALASATNSTTVDGGPPASVSSVAIGDDGKVTANFSNGTSRVVAQVALATFTNPDGLASVSGDAYQQTDQSGTFTLKTPEEAGAGQVKSSQLEASTVDLSTEFTGLIITQRAYSAASKIITTADQMLQELISVKQ
jgi:flagellar hook protein FlgE